MVLSPPPLYHTPFHSVIFLSVVTSHPARPPVISHGLRHEDSLHSRRPLIVAANEVDYESREAIDTTVYVETPRLEFLVSVVMKQCVRTTNAIHTAPHDSMPTAK